MMEWKLWIFYGLWIIHGFSIDYHGIQKEIMDIKWNSTWMSIMDFHGFERILKDSTHF